MGKGRKCKAIWGELKWFELIIKQCAISFFWRSVRISLGLISVALAIITKLTVENNVHYILTALWNSGKQKRERENKINKI